MLKSDATDLAQRTANHTGESWWVVRVNTDERHGWSYARQPYNYLIAEEVKPAASPRTSEVQP